MFLGVKSKAKKKIIIIHITRSSSNIIHAHMSIYFAEGKQQKKKQKSGKNENEGDEGTRSCALFQVNFIFVQ